MRLYTKVLRLILSGVLIGCIVAGQPVWAEQRTITATLNETDQLVSASGDVYELADTEAGIALLYEAVEDAVVVTGDVVEDQGINVIAVGSFKLLSSSTANHVEDAESKSGD